MLVAPVRMTTITSQYHSSRGSPSRRSMANTLTASTASKATPAHVPNPLWSTYTSPKLVPNTLARTMASQ